MNNNELESALIRQFGLEKTIVYCEMSAFIYNLMYEDIIREQPELNLHFAFDYESKWWAEKHDELIKKKVYGSN